jgi:hypothetical protein
VLAKLRPVYEGGVQTGGNSAALVDAAAASIVVSGSYARAQGKKPLARLVAAAAIGVPPEIMGIGPAPAIRLLLERTGLAAAPLRALAPADVSVLVRLLAPLTGRALYSKAGGLVVMAQMAIRYLAELGPEIVLPPLAVRLVDGLQAVTATHQTPMALSCLALLAPSMLDVAMCPQHALLMTTQRSPQSPLPSAVPSAAALRAHASGPRVMLEALQLALPGIDVNDLDKTAATLRLLHQVLLFVPLTGPRWASAAPLAMRASRRAVSASSAVRVGSVYTRLPGGFTTGGLRRSWPARRSSTLSTASASECK